MEDDNWLNKSNINCPQCKKELTIVDHSPFDDSCRLYCNSCPKRVEISYYDEVYNKINKKGKLD